MDLSNAMWHVSVPKYSRKTKTETSPKGIHYLNIPEKPKPKQVQKVFIR